MNLFQSSYLSILILSAFTFSGCSSSSNDDNGSGSDMSGNTNRNVVTTGLPSEVTRFEFPKVSSAGNDTIIVHYAPEPGSTRQDVNYSLAWDKTKKANLFTCYEMYANNRQSNATRYEPGDGEDQYPQDASLPSKYRSPIDPYKGSGYDHGHLCPSADRLYSTLANYQTFFLSNMNAQIHNFNAGIWEVMEEQLRDWISTSSPVTDTLFVCKGGTISEGNYTTGKNNLVVPKYFFSAVLMKNKSGYKAIGFWFDANNTTTSKDLRPYIVNIETLQEKTGLDFFCNLPDETEKEVENLNVTNVKRAWGFN
jgi:endonuclease G